MQLLDVVGLARPAGRVDLARLAVLVVRVRDVPERDRDAGFLHLRDVRERRRREEAVEAREARLVELIGDQRAVELLQAVCPFTVAFVQFDVETVQIAGLTYFAPNRPWKPV